MRPSDRAQLDINRLVDFRSAFIAMVDATKPETDYMNNVRLRPSVPTEKWAELLRAAALTSGQAATAYLRSGGATLTIRDHATQYNALNPVTNWRMCIEQADVLKPHDISISVDTAIGVATTRYQEAKDHERGLVGVIASFLRWPQTLREAVGAGGGQRVAAGAIGVVGQVIVGAIAAALGTGLVTGIVALWQALVP